MTTLIRRFFSNQWAGLLVADIVVAAVMSQATPAFVSDYNLYIVSRDITVTLLVALAQMTVLALGHMNVSVGGIGGLTAVLVGGMLELLGFPIWLAVSIGVLVGITAGLFNGILTVVTGINSFIITLATSIMFLGINLGLTQAIPFYKMPQALKDFGQARSGPLPHMGLITIVLTIALAIFLNRAVLGRQILAVGGNLKAAQLSGVPVTRAVLTAHAISGALAAIAGMLLMARLGSAQPSIGSDWVLSSFAGPVIGGASLTGGSVSTIGTALAVVLVSFIFNAVILINADPYWVQFLLGTLILVGVLVGRYSSASRSAGRAKLVKKPSARAPQPEVVGPNV